MSSTAEPKADVPIAAEMLKAYVERIERLDQERTDLAGDISAVYAEAKGSGFDVATLRRVIALRKLEHAERQEREALLDLYLNALGLL